MNTQELVKKLVEYINAGKNVEAEEELYADNVFSAEQDGTVAEGKAAVIAKTKAFADSVEQFFGGGVETAYAGKDSFLLKIKMDFKPKNGERVTMEEYGFYKVKDGKVSEEYFFASPLA